MTSMLYMITNNDHDLLLWALKYPFRSCLKTR